MRVWGVRARTWMKTIGFYLVVFALLNRFVPGIAVMAKGLLLGMMGGGSTGGGGASEG